MSTYYLIRAAALLVLIGCALWLLCAGQTIHPEESPSRAGDDFTRQDYVTCTNYDARKHKQWPCFDPTLSPRIEGPSCKGAGRDMYCCLGSVCWTFGD